MNDRKRRALTALHPLAKAGPNHPDAFNYAGTAVFEHMQVLALISADRAEALRLHRELLADDAIGAPRQTSRRQPDGTRRQLQVQRLFADRIAGVLARDPTGAATTT
jgi:hypothetical protein